MYATRRHITRLHATRVHANRSLQRFHCALVAVTLFAVTACSGASPTPMDGTEQPGGTSGNSMSAKINGAAWASASALVFNRVQTNVIGNIAAQGTQASPTRGVYITLGRIPGPGTYPLGVNWVTNAGGLALVTDGTKSWMTPNSGNAGSVTITATTATRIQGTFTFTAASSVDSTDKVVVTDGKFDVPRDGYAPPSAGDEGSFLRANIGTLSWNAGIANGSHAGTVHVISGLTDSHSISMTLQNVNAPGTYTLGVQSNRVSVIRFGAQAFWGGIGGDQGVITITSISARRIVGRFSGTLAPVSSSGATAPLSLTNVEFDVRIGN